MAAEAKSAGRCIVLTRAQGQNERLRAELVKLLGAGTRIVELPCVEFREAGETAALDDAIRALDSFDWILFTSQNAARYFGRRMRALGIEPSRERKTRAGAIGPATAEAAAAEGFSVSFVPPGGTGRTFAGCFKDSVRSVAGMEVKNPVASFLRDVRGLKILIPRSDLALRDRGATDWTETLRDAGANVETVTTYKTGAPEALAGPQLAEILRQRVDCVVFASPSAFENFVRAAGTEALEDFSRGAIFAAIGPTTASAIRAAKMRCEIEAAEPNPKSLAGAIAARLSALKSDAKSAASTPQGAMQQGAKVR
ncbi:MAG TPA: uroporphyrinogen-III synthase [Candidatus Acidoferrales bacterium]|nr:uroporphyrinogen-III synthase [Candidatus Acidoferrales bacterium]